MEDYFGEVLGFEAALKSLLYRVHSADKFPIRTFCLLFIDKVLIRPRSITLISPICPICPIF